MDKQRLTGYSLASQKLLSIPAELWEWALGKQANIAQLVFQLCAQALCSLSPCHYTPSLDVYVHISHHTKWISVPSEGANTTSFTALIRTERAPPATAAEAYTVWTNLPDRLNVVKEEP